MALGTCIRGLAGILLGLFVMASASLASTGAEISGDQLLYFYDARSSRVAFFGVSNPSPDTPVTIEIAFYPESLSERLGQTTRTLPPLGHVIIDPTQDAGGVAVGNAGLVVVTPVAASTTQPIVPPEPLVGTFTLANVALKSAFGENPVGRAARNGSGDRPAPGTNVDGASVSYERITPSILMVPVFYNPQDLGPVGDDGNRVILIAFDDQYGSRFDVGPHSDTVEATVFDAAGVLVSDTEVSVQGVRMTNLQAIANPTPLTSSGKAFFDVDAGSGNVLGLFSQSLGAFGAGQRMPAVFAMPDAATTPDGGAVAGDQLLFFYDGRSGRVPFLNVGNPSPTSAVVVDIAFYPQSLESRLGDAAATIPALGHLLIDPTQAAGGVAIGNAGLAVVTAVANGTREPIVPPEPLVGGFTLANVPIDSAFGENPIGRLATTSDGVRAVAGTTVDGDEVAFQRFTPDMLIVPLFFNPAQLGPVENDGNRVVLVSFSDQYGDPFDVRPRGDSVEASIFDGDGALVSNTSLRVQGVHLTNAQALAGLIELDSSGKIFFDVDAGAGSVFGLFSQSLGPFGAGQRLPAVDPGTLPTETPGPSPTSSPTPAGTQTPSATATASPTPTPAPTAPTSSPSPSPGPLPTQTPGVTVFGIPQGLCRNGIHDIGEECDEGTGNFECAQDADFAGECGPGVTQSWTCAYCANTFPIGAPSISPPPCGGLVPTVLVRVQPLDDRVCQTIGQGAVASCDIDVGGAPESSLCIMTTTLEPVIPDLDGLVEEFRQATCYGIVCAAVSQLQGDCAGKQVGDPCALDLSTGAAIGTCTSISGGLACLGGKVSLAN